MINDADKVIVKTDDPATAIMDAGLVVDARMKKRYEGCSKRNSKQYLRSWKRFYSTFDDVQHDGQFVNEIIDITSGTPTITNRLANVLGWGDLGHASETRTCYINSARLVVFALWRGNAIILPLSFNFKTSINSSDRMSLGTEIISFMAGYKASPADEDSYGLQVQFRVNNHSMFWIFSTDWHKFEDISIEDVALLTPILIKLNSTKGLKAPPPSLSTVVVPLLLEKEPGRLQFSKKEWDEHVEEATAKSIQKTIATRYGKDASYLHSSAPLVGYFRLPPELQGTGFEFTEDEAKKWNALFDGYLNYRQNVQGYEAVDSIIKSLRVLADYISVCLPQYRAEARLDKGKISVPKDFTRYPFIDQIDQPMPFPTFLNFCATRSSSSDGQRVWIGAAHDFFLWLDANYSGKKHKDIVGPKFRVPIAKKFDIPQGKKRSKTNKKPFGARVIPHLIKWLYAVEEFGMHLQSEGVSLKGLNPYDEALCEDYGFVPSYDFLGTKYDVIRVPVALLQSLGAKSGVCLTGLRMFMLSFETGMRMQSAQWLDRRTWDQCNEDAYPGQEVFTLFVNTDKTHEEWETNIFPRTRQLLLREQSYQESLGVPWHEEPYEGRANSRFPDIEPLFRDITNTKSQTIDDKKYDKLWKHVVFPFQRYALHSDLKLPLLCKYEKPATVKVSNTNNGGGKCWLKEKVFHTPHACRSTYISRRSSLISLDIIADQVGHTDKVVTSHYNYTEFNELSKKLEHADNAIMAANDDVGAQVTSGPAFVKAKDVNSALQKSFKSDRDETISRYNMISLSTSHRDGDDVESGLDLLRASRANEIKWDNTHVCPVGGECPEEVVVEAREARRCGICPYACKSIENLPHIAAKRKAVYAQAMDNTALYHKAKSDLNRQDELDEIYDRIQADLTEYYGWTASEEILNKALERGEDAKYLHTYEPEIVRKHLKRVVKESTLREFVLERIVEAREFPSLRTDELRMKAGRLMRSVMSANSDAIPDFFDNPDPDAELKLVAHAVTSRMKAEGLSISQVSDALDRPLIEAQNVLTIPAKEGGG